MTQEQRRKTKQALEDYRLKNFRRTREGWVWARAIDETMAYYKEADPLREQLLRLRYFEHRTVEQTQEALNIGGSTYQKANSDLLSTIAVFAARGGVL